MKSLNIPPLLSNQEDGRFNLTKPGPGVVMDSTVGLTNLANSWSISIVENTLHPRPATRGDVSSGTKICQAHTENRMNY